jgi:tryptophan halogenase
MKIVICGGGTAGWLAALMIKKIQTNHEIVVIESSKIGIVGAGEGSTGYLTDIIQGNTWDYGCDEEEFIKETGATIKLGIKHKDWRHVGHTYYGPIDGPDSGGSNPDLMFMWAKMHDYPLHTSSRNGFLIENKVSNFFQKDKIAEDGMTNTHTHGYHFDAHKVGQYFKKVVTKDGVKHIDSEIVKINSDESGITSIVLSNGQEVSADIFIDCTGFARVLMKELDVNWVSYNENLPVNTAMPFLLPYKDGEIIEPVTTAWAQKAGWMWQIPTADRYGCGYVFSDKFITHEEAQEEIESVLGQKIKPIKFLKFDTGRLEKLWHKNCLALGLCAAFAEPLEATSIHSTIVQLQAFIWDYLKDDKEATLNSGSQFIYNRRMTNMYDEFKDFLVLHYQTERRDTEFWRYVTSGETITPQVENVIEMAKYRIPSNNDFHAFYGYAGSALWNWVLDGIGKISKETVAKEWEFWGENEDLTKFRWDAYQQTMSQEVEKMIDNTAFIRQNS